jgi:hypothetical protein
LTQTATVGTMDDRVRGVTGRAPAAQAASALVAKRGGELAQLAKARKGHVGLPTNWRAMQPA